MKFKVDIQEMKDDPPPKKSNGLVFTLTLTLTISLTISLKIIPDFDLEHFFCNETTVCSPSYTSEIFFYDTNKGYDKTIKGDLTRLQLVTLDKILQIEQTSGGRPLDRQEVWGLCHGDREIINAYARWLRIKRLYRSDDHVIYPDERERFQASTLRVAAY